MSFAFIRTEGGLIPADVLEQIASGEASGQRPQDFGLNKGQRLTDEIAAAWGDARAFWEAFQRALARTPDDDPATTPTREMWLRPLLGVLGYDLLFMPNAAVVEGQTYAISHRAGEDDNAPPVHLVGFRADLDRRPPSGRPRLSPHALVQEYLNRTEFLWGLVANGDRLRLLRDSSRVTRPHYVEFDLRGIMQAEAFAEFAIFYRLLHRTRLPLRADQAAQCWLERYHQQGIEAGGRVREGLRDGVEEALKRLGNGFLRHPANTALRARLTEGTLVPTAYYAQLLRLIYRLLFLMVSEERGLIGASPIYQEHYSISRLRAVAEQPAAGVASDRHCDLWLGARATFQLFTAQNLGRRLGLEPLNGGLFSAAATPDLDDTHLSNADFTIALRCLSLYRENTALRRVNYAALDVEELGSVYESLLDYHPVIIPPPSPLGRGAGGEGWSFDLAFGSERKTTGSYYTRPELVHELIKSALEPVVAARLAEAKTPADKERALLALKVCDPAMGSGHFMLAAARRLGRELARVRSGEDEPTPEAFRAAVRDVIRHCIYGVDLNPLAVDLGKLALWLESYDAGKPLTFLDHHIQWGNSLVGVGPTPTPSPAGAPSESAPTGDGRLLEVPDEAFNPVTGDHKPTAQAVKRRNKAERAGQMSLTLFTTPEEVTEWAAQQAQTLVDLPDDTAVQVHAKAKAYQDYLDSAWYKQHKLEYDLWTAAFFWPLREPKKATASLVAPTHGELLKVRGGQAISKEMEQGVTDLAERLRFFHWELAFPEVFVGGGFDTILGNPPWERIKLQEKEFFSARDPSIAAEPNKATRQKLIDILHKKNPTLAQEFKEAIHSAEAQGKFVHDSGHFLLTAVGDVNTYALFSELVRNLSAPHGRTGIIVPTGIATDDTTKDFFRDLIEKKSLTSFFGFKNEEFLFARPVEHTVTFGLLTMLGAAEASGQMEFTWLAYNLDHMNDKRRRVCMTPDDFGLFNPNTRNCPVFRTSTDVELTRQIYRRVPVLVNEDTRDNPWGGYVYRAFDMYRFASVAKTSEGLKSAGGTIHGNTYRVGEESYLPLYESKLIHQYDHRYATYEGLSKEQLNAGLPTEIPLDAKTAHEYLTPRFWFHTAEVDKLLGNKTIRRYLVAYRNIARSTDIRSCICAIVPYTPTDYSVRLFFSEKSALHLCAFAANSNSLVFDYVVRQKLAGANLSEYVMNQLPVIPPHAYAPDDLASIANRVLELTYTAYDLQPFAQDILNEIGVETWNAWFPQNPVAKTKGPITPFRWDEVHRALLRAELDACYAKLYGLTRDELRYILDPKDVYGPDFPGETFRVLKEKEERLYGEYRTRRLVLEAWDRLVATM